MEAQHWTTRIPWWVKWAAGGASGIGGTVGASSVLPVHLQMAGVVVSSTLALVSLFGVVVHLTNEVREARGKRRIKLEPYHLVWLGLLIAALGAGWQWYRGSPQQSAAVSGNTAVWAAAPPPPSHYGIAWNFDDPAKNSIYLGGGTSPGQEWTIMSFQASGVNVSNDFISCSSGYIRSELTSKKLSLFFVLKDQSRVSIDEANAIPPGTEFQVVSERFDSILRPEAPGKAGIRLSRLMAEFGGFQFVWECDKGTYKRQFSAKDIRDLFARIDSTLPGNKPQITKRQ